MTLHYEDATIQLHHGDCLDVLRTLPDASVDAVCTDPPYGLEFMGKEWDSFKAVPSGGSGFSADGMGKGFHALPSFTGSPNPSCRNCGGTQRGADGQGVKRCHCEAPEFPNVRRAQGVAFQQWCEMWATECLRVLKPGGHLLAFGGTRTSHRLACAVEDAGFEIRDSIAWLYGSGFPKSLDVSKAIDKAAGAEREVVGSRILRGRAAQSTAEKGGTYTTGAPSSAGLTKVEEFTAPATDAARTWQGWGTALKPAHEPVVVARKPLSGTVAGNVLAHGTGALNIDGCRVGRRDGDRTDYGLANGAPAGIGYHGLDGRTPYDGSSGRWPANVVLDESQAAALDQQSGEQRDGVAVNTNRAEGYAASSYQIVAKDGSSGYGGSGGASRYFYTAKADAAERVRIDGTAHPTVKPLALMRWLVRLVCPPGGVVLEPFAGSGTTVEACILEGFRCVAIERELGYLPLILQRIHRRRDPVAAVRATGEDGGLFDLLGEGDDEPVKPAGGRWPPNVVMDTFQAAELDKQSGEQRDGTAVNRNKDPHGEQPHEVYGDRLNGDLPDRTYGGMGGASRFFPVFDDDEGLA